MTAVRGTLVALSLALCLAVPYGQALAWENETEMTGGFTPVELGTGTGGSQPSGSPQDEVPETADVPGETSGSETELSQGAPGVEGMRLDDGSVVTVDGNGHLALVKPSGETRVLDDRRAYAVDHRDDGSVAIRDESGEEVSVEGTTVRYTSADGERVSVDAVSAATAGDEAQDALGKNETEMSNEGEVSEGALNAPAKLSSRGSALKMGALLVVAGLAAAGIVFWWRRNHNENAPQ